MASHCSHVCVRFALVLLISSFVGAPHVSQSDAIAYLERYGYLDATSSRQGSSITAAIRTFQWMSHLPQTGVIDDATSAMMEMKRCGNRDIISPVTMKRRRRKRYLLGGSRWYKNVLSYRIMNYSPDFPWSTQVSEIRRAFDLWAKYIPLRFVRTYGTPDIEIKFAVQDHGDGHPFDGPSRGGGVGTTLAHAFYPIDGGDIHMDDDETFTAFDPFRGINFLQLFTHEIGHSLGLSHCRYV